MKEIWLSIAYLGTVSYYHKIEESEIVYFEAHESFEKQSWRNRMRILAANGPMDLCIPVIKGHSPNQPIRDVQIDYAENWQKVHFKSVESAYRHAPYYEYLIDDLRWIWDNREKYLFDYDLKITDCILKMMQARATVKLTETYQKPGFYGESDYRYLIHPKAKKQGTGENPVPYHQVFSDRYGFVKDLSVIDWLFNDFRI